MKLVDKILDESKKEERGSALNKHGDSHSNIHNVRLILYFHDECKIKYEFSNY